MTATTSYVLSQITSIMPKTVLNNLLVVFTNTKDPLDLNFDINQFKIFFQRDIDVFYIENPYCKLQKAKLNNALSINQIASRLQESFETTAETLTKLIERIVSMEPVFTLEFVRLHQLKEGIEHKFLITLKELEYLQKLDNYILTLRNQLQQAQLSKNYNQGFETSTLISTAVLEDTIAHNTLCTGCNSNCHLACSLPFGLENPQLCHAMKNSDTCTLCFHKASLHYHKRQMWKTQTQRAENAKNDEEKQKVLLTATEEKRKEVEKRKEAISADLQQFVSTFEEQAAEKSFIHFLKCQIGLLDHHLQGEEAVGRHAALDNLREKFVQKLNILQNTT